MSWPFAARCPHAPSKHSVRLRVEALEPRCLLSDFYVAKTGSDLAPGTLDQPFRTIQHGLAVATHPGDTVTVRAGTYKERISFPASGTAAGDITLESYPGERPVIDGGWRGGEIVRMNNVSYVRLVGFEIAHNRRVRDAAGVRVVGAGSHVEIRNNRIHDIRGMSAVGIGVFGLSTATPIADLVIDGNEIYGVQFASSGALGLSGNVTNFAVTNNRVHDSGGSGIELIGGATDTNSVRGGVVRGNTISRLHSPRGPGSVAGIYVNGGKDLVVEGNVSSRNDLGIVVGGAARAVVTRGASVRNNLVYDNDTAGLVIGGLNAGAGDVQDSSFQNNTLYRNASLAQGVAELAIQHASGDVVTNNIFWAGGARALVHSEHDNVDVTLDYNLWFADVSASRTTFFWNGARYDGFDDFVTGTDQDAHSRFADPRFVDAIARDFHLRADSPALDAGTATAGRFAPADFAGAARPQGVGPDIGAFEASSSQSQPPPPCGEPATRDPAYWPFSPQSPWNQPIGSAAMYDSPDSPGFDPHGKAFMNSTEWSHPVFVASASDPMRNIYQRRNGETPVITMPVPANAAPDPMGDGHLHIIDPTHQFVVEMYQAHVRANGDIDAADVVKNDLGGPGVYPEWHGARAYGGSAIGGLIRQGEILHGIHHALAIATRRAAQNKLGPDGQPFVWPASAGDVDVDSATRGNLFMGSLLAIPASVDITQIGIGSAGPLFEVARALQDYGAYITDTSGTANFVFYAEPAAAHEIPDNMDSLVAKLLPYLRVVSNNDPNRVGGGGTPRVCLAPNLMAPTKIAAAAGSRSQANAHSRSWPPGHTTPSDGAIPVFLKKRESEITVARRAPWRAEEFG